MKGTLNTSKVSLRGMFHFILLIAAFILAAVLFMIPSANRATAHQGRCGCCMCHSTQMHDVRMGRHSNLACTTCHEGATAHAETPTDPNLYPKVHFDLELCKTCHIDQYNTFETVVRGRTIYGGSDSGPNPPKGWSKTVDFPYWNVLIDGHPFVEETYEDSPMAVNQIEHQETIRPGSEACLACHGTKVAYYTGANYLDAAGIVHSIPARERVLKSAHTIYDGTTHKDLASGEWVEEVTTTIVPAGTRVSTYIDGINPPLYQVKTLVTLPSSQTVALKDGSTITFRRISSYGYGAVPPVADINGNDTSNAEIAGIAREWIYASLEALAFDGLDYYFDDPHNEPTFTGGGANWPTVVAGELCNQCHNPMSTQLRVIKKSLIIAIAQRGMNPYSPSGSQVKEFNQGTYQDQISAICGQCHSEYVGGYSAIDMTDRDFFPWGKPDEVESQYWNLFNFQQDWNHGAPVVPWQSTNSNARGFFPYGLRFPINAPLVKIQHPEAEEFWNSKMYNAGATCMDCHSHRATRPDGTFFTSHWITSPLKMMDVGINPCNKCHTGDSIAQSRQKIKDLQDNVYFVQERAQVALVNALRYINEQQAGGADMSTAIATYQRAGLRWEYYTQAENSMGFHNYEETLQQLDNARTWADSIVPWPLTPVKLRVTGVSINSLTLTFYDQAVDETGFIIERSDRLEGAYTQVANLPTPNSTDMGEITWTDSGLTPNTTYYYRVAAYDAVSISVYSIWTTGTTTLCTPPTAPADLAAVASGRRFSLIWSDNSTNEDGFAIERADGAQEPFNFIEIGRNGANTPTFMDISVASGQTYTYRVRAYNLGGYSDYSNLMTVTVIALPPAAPSQLRVTSVRRNSITLTWVDNSADEDGFYIERSTDGGYTWVRIASIGANATTYTNSGLVRRRTYWYRVQAYNADGASGYSESASGMTR